MPKVIALSFPSLKIQLIVVDFHLRIVTAENKVIKVPDALVTGQHWPSDIATTLLPG
jgi:hypothetical protein